MMGSSILHVVSVSVGRRVAAGLGVFFAMVFCFSMVGGGWGRGRWRLGVYGCDWGG
jgi:hypothetical protein